jgi:hypothetical protein
VDITARQSSVGARVVLVFIRIPLEENSMFGKNALTCPNGSARSLNQARKGKQGGNLGPTRQHESHFSIDA